MIGRTLSHYKVLEKVGSGGMGDVYLAEDTKLDREVALKVLPPELAENEDRRARFQREAKTLASLNHPNIVTVHSVEKADGVHFITMELVKGKTLAEVIPTRGMELPRFFEIAALLVDAVAAAHEAGIIHRDLKPTNVMVGENGGIKVLDFGLAHAEAPIRVEGDSESPTALKTQEGVLAGTLHYMSPEQAEGKSVDHRTDIFLLGVIFYEMLTGERPFVGSSPTAVLSSILKDSARPVNELRPQIQAELGRIVRRCLTKDLKRRFQDARDLLVDLDECPRERTLPKADKAETKRWRWVSATVALTLLGALAGYSLRGQRTDVSSDAPPRLANPIQVTFDEGLEDYPDWSPDGRTLAYHSNASGNFDIWIQQLGGGAALDRTADHPGADRFASWSPDGNQIAFWSDREGGGYFVMGPLSGTPRKVSSARDDYGAARWSSDGKRLAHFQTDESGTMLNIVSLQGGKDIERVPVSEAVALGLAWHPNHEWVAYLDAVGWTSTRHPLRIQRFSDNTNFFVTDGQNQVWSPFWSPDGRYLYYLSDHGGSLDLWRRGVTANGEPSGAPRALTIGLGIRSAALAPGAARLAYSKGSRVANVWRVPYGLDRLTTWSDAEQMTFDQALIEFVDVSRDGSLVLFDSTRSGNADLWMLEVENRSLRQITTHPEPDWEPTLSPDGQEIAFYSTRNGNREIWIVPTRGGDARQMTDDPRTDIYPTWSPDGTEFAYASHGSNFEIRRLSRHEAEPRLVHTLARQPVAMVRWSPDGSWLSFRDGGRLFRVPASGGVAEALTLGAAGDFAHCWSPDSSYVYFLGAAERAGNIWRLSLEDRTESQVTDLSDRRGSLGQLALAADDRYTYFTWEEDVGDIWVMDVVTDEK